MQGLSNCSIRPPVGCLILALYLLASATVMAQIPYLQMRLNGPGNGYEYIYALNEVGSNIVVTSGTERLTGGPWAMCSVAFDSEGNVLSKDELYYDSVAIINGYRDPTIQFDESILLGGTLKWGEDSLVPIITRVSSSGTISSPIIINDNFKRASFVDGVENDDGSLTLLGSIITDTGYLDFLLVKADVSGNIKWVKSYGTDTWDQGLSICKGPDGGFFLGGESRAFAGGANNNIFIIRVDSNGKEIWRNHWGGYYGDIFGNLEYNPDVGLLFTGYKSRDQGAQFGSCAYIMLVDEEGGIAWDQCFTDVIGDTMAFSLFNVGRFLTNGNIIVAGEGNVLVNSTSRRRPVAVILDDEGNVLRMRAYTAMIEKRSFGWFEDIKELSDGRIIAGGVYVPDTSNAQDTGNQDILIVELDENGCEYPGCQPPIGVGEVEFSESHSLRAYPNPFNSSIRFEIPPVVGQLSIYSMSGSLIDQVICSDPEKTFVDYSNPSMGRGIYLVTFTSDQLNQFMNARIVKL